LKWQQWNSDFFRLNKKSLFNSKALKKNGASNAGDICQSDFYGLQSWEEKIISPTQFPLHISSE